MAQSECSLSREHSPLLDTIPRARHVGVRVCHLVVWGEGRIVVLYPYGWAGREESAEVLGIGVVGCGRIDCIGAYVRRSDTFYGWHRVKKIRV